ncbi:MAG: hypothetical protein KA461_14430 [Flavobacterium sp.]|nr:hypothetical protein [Flavobacterium sp.]
MLQLSISEFFGSWYSKDDKFEFYLLSQMVIPAYYLQNKRERMIIVDMVLLV